MDMRKATCEFIIRKMVSNYRNIRVFDATFSTPYWMNKLDSEFENMEYGPYNGKATPIQISILCELEFRAHLNTTHLGQRARDYCEENSIGIDCSGFVYHTVSELLLFAQKSYFPVKKQYYPDELFKGIQNSGRLRRVNADRWTSGHNGYEINGDQSRPGDLVRFGGGDHVAIVVQSTQGNLLVAHSTDNHQPTGVRLDTLDTLGQEPDSFWRLNLSDEFLYGSATL